MPQINIKTLRKERSNRKNLSMDKYINLKKMELCSKYIYCDFKTLETKCNEYIYITI